MDPIIYIPAQTKEEAQARLPAGYLLTGQANGDEKTGAKVYRAVLASPDEDIGDAIKRAETQLAAQKGQDAVYKVMNDAVNQENARIQNNEPLPPPAPSSPAGVDYYGPYALVGLVLIGLGAYYLYKR